jgi:hypothetical protein
VKVIQIGSAMCPMFFFQSPFFSCDSSSSTIVEPQSEVGLTWISPNALTVFGFIAASYIAYQIAKCSLRRYQAPEQNIEFIQPNERSLEYWRDLRLLGRSLHDYRNAEWTFSNAHPDVFNPYVIAEVYRDQNVPIFHQLISEISKKHDEYYSEILSLNVSDQYIDQKEFMQSFYAQYTEFWQTRIPNLGELTQEEWNRNYDQQVIRFYECIKILQPEYPDELADAQIKLIESIFQLYQDRIDDDGVATQLFTDAIEAFNNHPEAKRGFLHYSTASKILFKKWRYYTRTYPTLHERHQTKFNDLEVEDNLREQPFQRYSFLDLCEFVVEQGLFQHI